MRVTNWAYGVQLAGVLVDVNASLFKVPDLPKMIEIISDSLSAGQYATYESISSWSWGFAEGYGNAEFSITAYPGICLVDQQCYGNLLGQAFQWLQTSDTLGRAIEIWGNNTEPWDFSAYRQADITVIDIGTNDNNTANNVTGPEFQSTYLDFTSNIHGVWPDTQIGLIRNSQPIHEHLEIITTLMYARASIKIFLRERSRVLHVNGAASDTS